MYEEPKKCPFCGDEIKIHPDDDDFVLCFNPACPIYEVDISLGDWNTRPSLFIPITPDTLPDIGQIVLIAWANSDTVRRSCRAISGGKYEFWKDLSSDNHFLTPTMWTPMPRLPK